MTDFSNTLSFSLAVPEGVTFTAVSGVVPGVPEPAGLVAVLAPLVLLRCRR